MHWCRLWRWRWRWRWRNLTKEHLELFRRLYSPALDDASARAPIWYVRNRNYFVQGLDRRHDVLLVNYEDLVADPLRELCEALTSRLPALGAPGALNTTARRGPSRRQRGGTRQA